MNRYRTPALALLLLSMTTPAHTSESDAPALIRSARAALARDDQRALSRLVAADRAAAYESVFTLTSTPDAADDAVAKAIADAYLRQYSDASLIDWIRLNRAWTPEQRATHDEAYRLKTRGIDLTGEGHLAEAREHFEKAIPMLRDLGDLRNEGRCLSNLGAIEGMQGNNQTALEHLREARLVTARAGDLGMVSLILVNEAYAMENLGDLKGSAEALASALPAARAIGDIKAETAILINMGSTQVSLGNRAAAIPLFRQAAELARKSGDPEAESAALFNLSDMELKPGEEEATYRLLRRSIEVAKQAALPRSEADAELKFAMILRRAGDAGAARTHLVRARQVSVLTEDSILKARVEIEEANQSIANGQYARALPSLDRAESILGDLDMPALISILHSVRAVALYYIGEYEQSVTDMGVAIAKATEASRLDLQAETRQTRGLLLCLLGETSFGLQELEAAARMHQDADETRLQATAMEAIGAMRFKSGDTAGGRAALEKALSLLGPDGDTATHAEILTELAAVDLATGSGGRDQPIRMLKRAMDLFVMNDDLHGVGLAGPVLAQAQIDEGDLAAAQMTLRSIHRVARGRESSEFEWQVELSQGQLRQAGGDDAGALKAYRQAVNKVERLRGGVRPALWRAAILEDRIAPYRALVSLHLRHSDTEQAWLWARAAKARTFTEQLTTAEFPLTGATQDLPPLTRSLPADLMPSPVVAGARLRALLASDELLLDFFFTTDDLMIFVVTRGGMKVTKVPLARLPAGLLQSARYPGRPEPADEPITAAWRRAMDRLGPILFESLGPELGAARHLLISPGGALHGIPFAALKRDGRMLVESHTISILPAAEALLSRRQQDRTVVSAEGPVLALGDPLVADGARRLPGAAAEARRIVASAGPGSLLAVGEAAREQTVKDRGATFARIHLAAHGRIDRVAPQNTFIALAAGGGQDGRLSAAEIASLKLPIPLVVLSGCDTGVEEGLARATSDADERIGLPRAFLSAGAGVVVAGLWEMEDAATQAIMPGLHERLPARTIPQALAKLQNDLIHGTIVDTRGRPLDHPFYWAALTAYGAGFGAERASSVASAASARSVRKVEP